MDDDLKFQLVLQLPGTTQQDFDALLSLEESLAEALDGTPTKSMGTILVQAPATSSSTPTIQPVLLI
jgi:hypothetical protein